MTENRQSKPLFSVIIPILPENQRPLGLDHVDRLDWPREGLEVILARGRQPCRQRNQAADAAKGEVLVFFDDDSCPSRDYLQRLAEHFVDPNVAGVGGPNPALPSDRYAPSLIEAVFTSPFSVFSKRARYKSTGKVRYGGDSDLIFCNFAMRRDVFLQLGGLDDRLYPNEENEFFECFRQNVPDRELLYDPNLPVSKPRSATMWLFLRKILGYGKGRACQFKIRPTIWSGVHLVACLIPILAIATVVKWGLAATLYPVAVYAALLLATTTHCLISNKQRSLSLGIAGATFAMHAAYLLGMWVGLFSSTSPAGNVSIALEHYQCPNMDIVACGPV